MKNNPCKKNNIWYVRILLFFWLIVSCGGDLNLNQNNLNLESSAYLKQHANNPIHWQPWNDKLYQKFNSSEKLIVVSIGYSSCHWCHVMEKETFEDREVANYMNEYFINIKVDREENPEIDNIYMTATQMLTGNSGWPLNVVCLPDGRPIYGGTYHSREQWAEILSKIQEVYENDKQKLIAIAEKVKSGIQEVNRFEFSKAPSLIEPQLLIDEMDVWSKNWDYINGGELANQKFINPVKFNFIQQYYHLNQDDDVEKYFENSLQNIAVSGIVDHLEGGFFRYTVDPEWKIPHFEKMLYDNAQLLSLYANAYKSSKNPLYKATVYQTFDFLMKRMANEQGAFFSAIDADNDAGEGLYYVFDLQELNKVGGDDISLLLDFYRIDLNKPFSENYFHLRSTTDIEGLAKKNQITIDQLIEKKQAWENQLETLKVQRDFPLVDNKIITSWNALAISGLVSAYEAFGDSTFLFKAKQTLDFIQNHLIEKDELMHTFQDSKAKGEANLEDYAFTIKAALDIYKNTGEMEYLDFADRLIQKAMAYFQNKENPFFTFTKKPVLFSEIIALYDNTMPAANSIMCENLWILSQYFDNKDFKLKARQMLDAIVPEFKEGRGVDYTKWADLLAQEAYSHKEVVIIGPNAKEVSNEIQQNYLSNVLFQISEVESDLPLLNLRFSADETLIYVCENKVCMRPTKDVFNALQQIKKESSSINSTNFKLNVN